MPNLYKPKKKREWHKGENKEKTAKVYNKYRPIRMAYLMEHPLCEDCLNPNIINEDGSYGEKITAVQEVHHLKPILSGSSELEMMDLGLNSDNLVGLCEFHHHLRHKIMRDNG